MWKKVLAPTLLVSLLWIAASGGTTYYINWLHDSQSRILNENVATIQTAGSLHETLWRLHASAIESAYHRTPSFRADSATLQDEFARLLDQLERTAKTPPEQQLVRAIHERFADYVRAIRRLVETELPPQQSSGADVAAAADELARIAATIATPCEQLLEYNQNLIDAAQQRRSGLSEWIAWLRLALLLAGPAVGILLGVVVARNLRRSVSEISVTLRDASGNLSQEVGRVEIRPSEDLMGLHEQVQAVAARMKSAAQELDQARREIVRAERLAAVGEVAAGVAHEIRNPLTNVKLLFQSATQKHPERPLSSRQIQVIQSAIARMETTIQNLLDFARPPQMNRSEHDLRDTVRRAINLVEGRARQQMVIVRETCPDQPVQVDGDPEQLHQVLVNLLLNGIEAMPDGGVLQVTVEPDSDDKCTVKVADTGTGIPDSVMNRLFEPFVTTKERGTGLGLAVSRRLVQEHGGNVVAQNRPEGGAVFCIELPRDGDLIQDQ